MDNKVYYKAILCHDGNFEVEEYTEPDAEKIMNRMYAFYETGRYGEYIVAETKEGAINTMKSKIIDSVVKSCQEINEYNKQLEAIKNYEQNSNFSDSQKNS